MTLPQLIRLSERVQTVVTRQVDTSDDIRDIERDGAFKRG